MCEELNVNIETEETPQSEEPITPPQKLPMEDWWGGTDDAQVIDVTPQLPQQPVMQQDTYYTPQPEQQAYPTFVPQQKNELSLVSLVLGLISLTVGYIPIFGWAVNIAAIITGVISKSKGDNTPRGTLGIVFGAIGAVAGLLLMLYVIIMLNGGIFTYY